MSSAITHWGPNCATLSPAGEIPIPGVVNAPQPLRPVLCPVGLPKVVGESHPGASGKVRQRVLNDTLVADLSAVECLKAHRDGRGSSSERPGRSLALHLPSWKSLMDEPGVFCIWHHHCCFEDSTRRKFQVVITNIPQLKEFVGTNLRLCQQVLQN